jgi:hypothetical protein
MDIKNIVELVAAAMMPLGFGIIMGQRIHAKKSVELA